MKTSIIVATFLVVSGGAASAGALTIPHNNYQGSDTLFNVTRQAMGDVSGLTPTDYIGGGSGNGQAAMAAATPTQTTAPMSRMMNNGGGLCTFAGGTAGSTATSASSLVIGLDAVDILASTTTAASAACTNGAGGPNGVNGILFSGGSINATTWKDALALVYGGKDNQTGNVDCNQASRVALVANWSNLFQNGCANASSTCSDANHSTGTGITAGTAPLWHAWRRDETSGTSDVFSSILGITPSTSSSAVNGFGTSPYCNAMNWDTVNNTKNTCVGTTSGVFNPHAQFTGPGGVVDTSDPNYPACLSSASTLSATSCHRMPPPGLNGLQVYGAAPAGPPTGTTTKFKGVPIAFDVLPTDMQDNDPIRRQCYGVGTMRTLGKIGEDVCNIDGSLGLVISLVDTDFVATLPDPVHSGSVLHQYPPTAQRCGQFINGSAPNVFSCAPSNNFHSGECPNGDTLIGGQCQLPIATGFGQCNATSAQFAANFVRTAASTADGRSYNIFLTSGSTTDGGVTYIQQQIPALGTSIDFAGAFSRIHQIDVAVSGATACQMVDMTDQIGCLGQADPCSIGYAGDGGKGWNTHAVAAGGPTLPASAGIDADDVYGVYPQLSSVQALGTKTEYPLSRKLYFASLPGWSNVNGQELALAQFEAASSPQFEAILTTNDFFELGAQSALPAGGVANTTFCEDFDEQTVCGASANANGCTDSTNTGLPTVNTVCGNGTIEAYEECDNGSSNGTSGNKCSSTCRCTTYLDQNTGACH
jgi:hypothetical protein